MAISAPSRPGLAIPSEADLARIVKAVSPAAVNAIHAATGRRLRRLPVRPEDLVGWSPETPTPTGAPGATATPRPTDAPATPTPTGQPLYIPDARRPS